MNAQEISDVLDTLKVNSRGSIRGKNQAINKIQSMHWKEMDGRLMDIRVFVAKLSTGHSTKDALKMIDDFIYQKSI